MDLVLTNNRRQARALALGETAARRDAFGMVDLIHTLEADQGLDRALEGLPDDRDMLPRGLTRPELAVVMAYAKMDLKARLLETPFDTDPWYDAAMRGAFPAGLLEAHPEALEGHRLRREITATQWTNDVIHRLGIGFCCDVLEATNAYIEAVARAIGVVDGLFGLFDQFDVLESSSDQSAEGVADRDRATLALRREARRACTWLLRGGFLSERIESTIQRLRPALSGGGFDALPTVLAALELGTDPADALDRAVDLAATLRIADIGGALECALINSPWARLEARQLADDVTRMIATAAANPEVAERLAGPDLAAWLATVQELATDALPTGDGHEAVEQGTNLVRLRVIVRRLQDLAH